MLKSKSKEREVLVDDTEKHTRKEKTDLVFRIIGRFDFYINSTNTKASLIFAWNGIVIGSLLLKFNDILGLYPQKHQLVIGIFLASIGICAAISNIVAFQVIYPFLRGSNKSSENNSIFYFGSVASVKSEDYFDKVCRISTDEMLADITDQGVILARGLNAKMKWLKNSIIAVYFELGLILLLFVFRLITQ